MSRQDAEYYRAWRRRRADLARETRRVLREAAAITAAAGLPNLSARLAELSGRWEADQRRGLMRGRRPGGGVKE